ncbi:TetR/AcrR family transcriptional regulator [Massilia sp. YIM B02763]|uniref:TetR/AcrR family transcriptional regulator n=1 Tax=Massilia sp. YIM B02763 TaxID=3050130 RepID=UPI0025B63AF2|nr:TetR/AcrR family transcriptional regulator [Massilia sp. YIM B02763]MDN4053636.1 TetR/AcrR family transcriptional regulator [Massilia sp. YIM B02763]
MHPTAPTTRLTDRKRQAILAAAADQFRAHGFEGSSVDRIAALAGVSKRTVYNHFPSKDELFTETIVQLFHRSAGAPDFAYRADRSLRAQLEEFLALKMRSMADPDFLGLARVGIAEAIRAPERAQGVFARLEERDEGMPAWVRAAQADGRLKAGDPGFAATLLQGQLKTFAFWPQVTMGAPPLGPEEQARVIDAAVSMFLAYFGVPSD